MCMGIFQVRPPAYESCPLPVHMNRADVPSLADALLSAATELHASCSPSLQNDNVSRADVETLVDAFPGQSIDFFGALRARVYDDKVRSCGVW